MSDRKNNAKASKVVSKGKRGGATVKIKIKGTVTQVSNALDKLGERETNE